MLLAPALALLVGLGPNDADARPRINWEAPLECPASGSLEQRVHAYLGRALPSTASVIVLGRVHASTGGFVLELLTEVDGVRDRQRLKHHDCATLLELGASLAAIAIDPLAITEPRRIPPPILAPPSSPHPIRPHPIRPHPIRPHPIGHVEIQRPSARAPVQPPPTPQELAELATLTELAKPTTSPSPTTADPTEPARPTRFVDPPEPAPEFELYVAEDPEDRDPKRETRRTRALVLATGGLALNLFPNPAPQLRGGVGLQHGNPRVAFRALVDAGVTLAGQFRTADRSAGGDLLAWDAAIHPCGVPRWGRVELRVCAAFGAGQIRARGVGVTDALRRDHPRLWLAPEAGLAIELGRYAALILDVGAQFNVLRPNFSVTSPAASYLTPIVSGHGGLGVELRFF